MSRVEPSKFKNLKRHIVILVSGKAGVGKTTACEIIEKILTSDKDEMPFVGQYHFAAGVKHAAREFFGWDGRKDEKGRKLLQDVGRTGRNYDENVWANHALDLVTSEMLDVALVDDWRFPNELRVMGESKSCDVFTVRIHAPNREILLGTPEYEDVSETSLSENPEDYNYFIDNSGSMEELEEHLLEILEDISNSVEQWR